MSIEEKEYIPINKGHFELDTEERFAEFNKNLAEGWENEYQDYRSQWVELAKSKTLRDYPVLMDIELSSKCNLHCPMCYTITEEFLGKVDRKYMEFELFKKIIDEVAGKVYAVRLSLRGESTLNRDFIKCVEYAKKKGIKEVSTLTHGKKFTGDYLRKCVEAGIDWITISIDGTGEIYNKIRFPLTWESTLGRLKEIKDLKKELGVNKPVIKVQGVWPAIRHNPTEYYESLAPFSDLVAFNPLIDYLGNDSDIIYEENFSCPQLYQRMVIGSDGRVMMCSNDEETANPIGDVYKETVHEIWHGSNLSKIRDLHREKDGFKKIPVCKKCYYPRKAVPNEFHKINGREIVVENYLNRPQEVGL